MRGLLRILRDLALLVARIVTGVALIARGWYRWQINGIPAETDLLAAADLPNPELLVLGTIAFEIIGGTLLVFGLATPLIGLGIAAINVAVILTTKADAPFYAHEGGWEYNAIQAALGVMFLVYGSGRAGLDHLFIRPRDENAHLIADEPAAPVAPVVPAPAGGPVPTPPSAAPAQPPRDGARPSDPVAQDSHS